MAEDTIKTAGVAAEPEYPGMPIQEFKSESSTAVRARFKKLSSIWKQQTRHWSNVTKKCTHPAYQQIIGMGQAAVPLILQELREHGGDWFWALTSITGENPITEDIAGNVPKMVEAWIRWGTDLGQGL